MRDVNPLNVFDQRIVDYMPEHFTVINYTVAMENAFQAPGKMVENISNWIYCKLDGRFHVMNCGIVNSDERQNEMVYLVKIGFEEAHESTFFSLAYSPPQSESCGF